MPSAATSHGIDAVCVLAHNLPTSMRENRIHSRMMLTASLNATSA